MQLSTIVILVVLAALACAHHAPAYDAIDLMDDHAVLQQLENEPVHERSPRTKRGLLLLKKKLLLGMFREYLNSILH